MSLHVFETLRTQRLHTICDIDDRGYDQFSFISVMSLHFAINHQVFILLKPHARDR